LTLGSSRMSLDLSRDILDEQVGEPEKSRSSTERGGRSGNGGGHGATGSNRPERQ
jgi:hypothetical protein